MAHGKDKIRDPLGLAKQFLAAEQQSDHDQPGSACDKPVVIIKPELIIQEIRREIAEIDRQLQIAPLHPPIPVPNPRDYDSSDSAIADQERFSHWRDNVVSLTNFDRRCGRLFSTLTEDSRCSNCKRYQSIDLSDINDKINRYQSYLADAEKLLSEVPYCGFLSKDLRFLKKCFRSYLANRSARVDANLLRDGTAFADSQEREFMRCSLLRTDLIDYLKKKNHVTCRITSDGLAVSVRDSYYGDDVRDMWYTQSLAKKIMEEIKSWRKAIIAYVVKGPDFNFDDILWAIHYRSSPSCESSSCKTFRETDTSLSTVRSALLFVYKIYGNALSLLRDCPFPELHDVIAEFSTQLPDASCFAESEDDNDCRSKFCNCCWSLKLISNTILPSLDEPFLRLLEERGGQFRAEQSRQYSISIQYWRALIEARRSRLQESLDDMLVHLASGRI